MDQEFYFVRHGQTDHNILEGKEKGDHPEDISLNAVGRNQAAAIEPMIALLPIQTICVSPRKRALETKEIIAARLLAPHYEIGNLGECSGKIWKELASLRVESPFPADGELRLFMEQVRDGLNHALSLPGPLLIVAHGGVHWAICYLMGIENHQWAISNCAVVHFSIGPQGKWIASKL
jgi:probable phosphoglycerate mutase